MANAFEWMAKQIEIAREAEMPPEYTILPPAMRSVVHAMRHYGRPITVAELAEHAMTTTSTARDRMERAVDIRLVVKVRDTVAGHQGRCIG